MFPKDLTLRDLVSLEEWKRIQDSLSEALEISLRTIAINGGLLFRVSRPSLLCSKVPVKSPIYRDFCGNCLIKKEIKDLAEIKEDTNIKCSFGLDLFVVPITTVGQRVVAHLILGPVILNRRKTAAEYAQVAKSAKIDLAQLMDALIEVNVFSYNKIYSITKLVKDVFSHVVKTGYHKKRLGEMAPEMRKMDPLFLCYYEEKILNSMLNACTLALDADSGSVMTMDQKTQMLHIKVAAKLDQDVINKTNIKIGEGIAGVAVKIAQPIILPDDKNRRGLATKMKRQYIKSSMIVPFPRAKNHQVYGVINLNIVRKAISFTKKDIAFVQELLHLSSIALFPFQKNDHNSIP